MTVLVVGYATNETESIQDRFESEGHGCLTAVNVEEAEWISQNATLDAIAVNIETPGRSPLEWLEELCLANPDLAKCTVLITDRDLGSDDVLRIQACKTMILRTPLRIEVLYSLILQRVKETTLSRPRHAPTTSRKPNRTPLT